jgi:hypothetical protein
MSLVATYCNVLLSCGRMDFWIRHPGKTSFDASEKFFTA